MNIDSSLSSNIVIKHSYIQSFISQAYWIHMNINQDHVVSNMFEYIHIHAYTSIYIYIYIYVNIYICIYMYIYIYTHVFIHTYIATYAYMYMYVYIYIYISTLHMYILRYWIPMDHNP